MRYDDETREVVKPVPPPALYCLARKVVLRPNEPWRGGGAYVSPWKPHDQLSPRLMFLRMSVQVLPVLKYVKEQWREISTPRGILNHFLKG